MHTDVFCTVGLSVCYRMLLEVNMHLIRMVKKKSKHCTSECVFFWLLQASSLGDILMNIITIIIVAVHQRRLLSSLNGHKREPW